MSTLANPAKPIRALSSAEKARTPVSMAKTDLGESVVVSRYEDEIWDFWPYIPQNNARDSEKRINWRIEIAPGEFLTDHQHAPLLESTKDFIWSLFIDPIDGRQRPRMATVIVHVVALTPLLRWMASRGMRQFRDIEGRALEYVPIAKINQRTGKPTAKGWHARRLIVLEELYLQREKLADALPTHPWPDESGFTLSGERAKGRTIKTLRIPERTVRQLAEVAINYVTNLAPHILSTRDALEQAVANKEGFQATNIRIPLARELGFEGSRDLSAELSYLRDSCYIVIAMFSGIRDSETLSLKRGCIAHDKADDGIDLIWLHGTIFKTGIKPHKWLVPPIVETAVRVMEWYRQPYAIQIEEQISQFEQQLDMSIPGSTFHKRQLKRLHTARKDRDGLFLGCAPCVGHLVGVLSKGTIHRRLQNFCPHFNILGDDGKYWRLSSHQFRRTYAYFVASAELGDLHYLREHFGHWSIDMTLLYTSGASDAYQTDTDLLTEILRSKTEKQESVLHNYLMTDTPLANGDIMLADLRQTIKTAKNKQSLLQQISSSITLNGTGHSWCIGNAKGTSCGGLCVFEADMCVDCAYGMIGPEHLPVWKEIALQQQTALDMSDLGLPGKTRSQRILNKALDVIAKLEIPQ